MLNPGEVTPIKVTSWGKQGLLHGVKNITLPSRVIVAIFIIIIQGD